MSSIMGSSCGDNTLASASSNKSRAIALETTLHQSLVYFKELLLDIEELHSKIDDYKNKLLMQTQVCESQSCCSSIKLKKVIESKDNIIQLVASSLTKLSETKDLNIVNDIFKILFGEITTLKSEYESKKTQILGSNCDKQTEISPKMEEMKLKIENPLYASLSESVSEIEGTPTGCTSPIIQSRRLKSTLADSSDYRDKKKCPDNWPTPDKKSVKLTFPTPTKTKVGRLRQSKINLVKLTQPGVVDLTSSPEFGAGVRGINTDVKLQPLVKKESIEGDDTILPSPTSGPVNFTILKSILNSSPCKFKKPSLCLKSKGDKDITMEPRDLTNMENTTNVDEGENSSIFDPQMGSTHTTPKKKPPMKIEEQIYSSPSYTNESISLLKHIDVLDNATANIRSPHKRPLEENINIANVPETDMEESISLLRPELKVKISGTDCGENNENINRKTSELIQPVYKEPTVRTKAEKRALKGWSCDECKNFFGELYKNDPVMLAKKIEDCSKHRGRNNPIRPKTPPGFWNPRWEVPEDTEEFNRMNNAN